MALLAVTAAARGRRGSTPFGLVLGLRLVGEGLGICRTRAFVGLEAGLHVEGVGLGVGEVYQI